MIEALKDWDKKIEEALQEYRMTYTDVYGSPDKMEEFFKQQHKKFLEHYEKEKIDINSPLCADCPDFLKDAYVKEYNSRLYRELWGDYFI